MEILDLVKRRARTSFIDSGTHFCDLSTTRAEALKVSFNSKTGQAELQVAPWELSSQTGPGAALFGMGLRLLV